MKTLVSKVCPSSQEWSDPQIGALFDLWRYEREGEAPGEKGSEEAQHSPVLEPLLGQPRTGVDTLRLLYPLRLLRVPDFHVLTKSHLRKSRFGEHLLWSEENGRGRRGVMAVRRVGAFRFRIAPVRPGGPAMLRVFFSAPRARFGHNGATLSREDLITVLQGMQRTLLELGVDIDWPLGQVCRLDVCRDALLPRPFHYYRSVLRLIWPKYNRLCQNYPSGIVRGSQSRCVFTSYDKRTERNLRGVGGDGLPTPFSTWLRTECRLPTAAAVRDRSGIDTVADLVQQYDGLSAWIDERVAKDLLPDEAPPYIAFPVKPRETVDADDELWWQAQIQGPTASLKDRFALLGLRMMLESMSPEKGEPEVWSLLKEWCSDEAPSLSTIRAEMRRDSLEGVSDEILPIGQLYDELRNSILGIRWTSPSLPGGEIRETAPKKNYVSTTQTI